MPTHAHFEELCVLATSGQLVAAESDILNRHLVECDSCRSFIKDAHFVSDQVIPRLLHASYKDRAVPEGMRERFLARAASEAFKIEAGTSLIAALSAEEDEVRHAVSSGPGRFMWPNISADSLRPWPLWVSVGTSCAACFILGLLIKTPSKPVENNDANKTPQQNLVRQPAPGTVSANVSSDRVRILGAEKDQLAKQIVDLIEQLHSVEKEKQQAASAMQQQVAMVEYDAEQNHDAMEQQVSGLNARAADLQSQLATVRQQQAFTETELRSARDNAAEYSARLDLLQAQLRNQSAVPLPNPDGVSSLVAARNLHIIDVYDSNPEGKRQRAFGRVFYVEGRSLVFYAYDLAPGHVQKNMSFHLWGEKVGGKETTLSLGVLYNDDPQERRWALTCNNPNLLAKINSVYVTVESPHEQKDGPQGPRVLYAYFGAPPNHP